MYSDGDRAHYVERMWEEGLTPTEAEDDVQRPSGPPESVSALVNRGYLVF